MNNTQKFKNIYETNEIDFECDILYGPIIDYTTYEFKLIENNQYYIFGKDSNRTHFVYAEVNENTIYKDTVSYGKQFYKILKNELATINHSWIDEREQDKIVSNESINKHIEEIKPLCLKFVKEYGIPISLKEYDTSSIYYDLSIKSEYYFIPIILMVRYSLLIFMLHTILLYLEKTRELYPNLYQCFFGKNEYGPNGMISILQIYLNSKNNLFYGHNKYLISLVINENNNRREYLPIRHTTNLYNFAYETFINSFCALSYKIEDYNEEKISYLTFRKCRKCLKNIEVESNINIENKTIPLSKNNLCEECKHKARLESKRNYEKNKRKKYEMIKAQLPNIKDKQLIYDIKHMKAKDKIRMYHLNELEDRIAKESDS